MLGGRKVLVRVGHGAPSDALLVHVCLQACLKQLRQDASAALAWCLQQILGTGMSIARIWLLEELVSDH